MPILVDKSYFEQRYSQEHPQSLLKWRALQQLSTALSAHISNRWVRQGPSWNKENIGQYKQIAEITMWVITHFLKGLHYSFYKNDYKNFFHEYLDFCASDESFYFKSVMDKFVKMNY